MITYFIHLIKTYYSIYYRNLRRFPLCQIETYVHPKLIIGKNTKIKSGCYISDSVKMIGDYVYIGNGAKILNCSEIGNYTSISHDVKIGLDNHSLYTFSTSPWVCKMETKSPCIIENDVLISANVVIMSGIKLGNGCVIGANSFVNCDIPPYAVAVGSPARIVKFRFNEEKIEQLENSEWWKNDPSNISEDFINKIQTL